MSVSVKLCRLHTQHNASCAAAQIEIVTNDDDDFDEFLRPNSNL